MNADANIIKAGDNITRDGKTGTVISVNEAAGSMKVRWDGRITASFINLDGSDRDYMNHAR